MSDIPAPECPMCHDDGNACSWCDTEMERTQRKHTPITFDEFSRINKARDLRLREIGPGYSGWSESDWACALAGEVGELCNLIKKRRRGESIPVEALGREMGDVVAYLDHLAGMVGADLGECVRLKFNEVSDRRPETAGFKL